MTRGRNSGSRVVVTGAAGYLGRALCRRLAVEPGVGEVRACDRDPAPPGLDLPPISYHRLDINDPALTAVLAGADAVCHLAFVLGSGGSDRAAARTNLDGSRHLVRAARAAGVGRLVVASSVSAYGARPDNPPRLREGDALQAAPDFRYAHHKAQVEQWLEGFGARHPGLGITRLRIATVLGPPPRPGDAASLLAAPVLALPRTFRVQFVHVDDVAAAFVNAIQRPDATGAFNLAAEPVLDGAAIARITGQRFLPLPAAPLAGLGRLARWVRLRDPGRLDFLRFPILVDCGRAVDRLGWRPRFDGAACLRSLRA